MVYHGVEVKKNCSPVSEMVGREKKKEVHWFGSLVLYGSVFFT